MPAGSKKVVYAGLAANVAIAVSKVIAAAVTGSTAMLAESMHSLVDSGNSLLLLLGLHRSRKAPDEAHPFGHGKELYFWSFVVAVSMFAVGGVLSIWEGISHLLHPNPIQSPGWSYLVLGLSASFSAVSLYIALREVYRNKGEDESIMAFIRRSKDPSVFTVALEDTTDLTGEIVALVCIFLSVHLHMTQLDGIGSIIIGFVLIGTSALLSNETRGLLIGESADQEAINRIRRAVERDPAVDRVGKLLTMQMGPNEVLVNIEIEFRSQGSIEGLEGAIDRIEREIRKQIPSACEVFLEAASLHAAPRQERRAS